MLSTCKKSQTLFGVEKALQRQFMTKPTLVLWVILLEWMHNKKIVKYSFLPSSSLEMNNSSETHLFLSPHGF